MTYDNTNRWTLNKNKDKRDEDDKDYNGSVNIDGREYWLNGWIKNGKNGAFISGTVKPKQPAAQANREDPHGQRQEAPKPDLILTRGPRRDDSISTGRPRNDDMDDNIPF